MPSGVSLALVDDHELFRRALGDLLTARGFSLVAEAGDARSSFPLIDQARPDVVLLDLVLPGMDGVTAVRELHARAAAPKVMILSAFGSRNRVSDALEAGASGYVLKAASVDELVGGISTVIAGERYLSPGVSASDDSAEGPLGVLSKRERDIFRLLVRGLTTRQMAAELCISGKTVETHRERILRKLGMHSAVQLVRFAAANDLLE
ncbi:MAG: DNA-binding response regulator [bacterium]|nr:DNA-binding response regulator [bacterium]